jgi:hypothetical protein
MHLHELKDWSWTEQRLKTKRGRTVSDFSVAEKENSEHRPLSGMGL